MSTPRPPRRHVHRVVPIVALGGLALAGVGLAAALPGSDAATTARIGSAADLPADVTYPYSPTAITIPVPAGADAVTFVAIGGAGGGPGSGQGGGKGAQVAGYALVKSGGTVTLDIGQQGTDGHPPNTGQGGSGGGGGIGGSSGATASSTNGSGGGGGGATAVSFGATTLAVAGGGGGSGGDGYGSGTDSYQLSGGEGGNAGATAGGGQPGDPYYASSGPAGGAGGGQGTATGGTGAAGSTTKLPGGVNGPGGGGGAGVLGGAGGSAGSTGTKGSGGGGGGAGSSMAAAAVFGPLISTAKTGGDGSVVVGWLDGFHLQLSTAAGTVTASSTPVPFTVTGTDVDGDPVGNVSDFVTLTSSVATDVVSAAGVAMTAGGARTITATWNGDPAVTASTTVTVNPGSASNVEIVGTSPSMPAGIPLQLAAQPVDQFGNYVGADATNTTWSSDVASDTWSGNQVTMTQLGVHKITVTVPGYPAASATVTITASKQASPGSR